MVTEEKMMLYDTSKWNNVCAMRDKINEQLGDGWKVKPACIHTTAGCTFITLYREVKQVKVDGEAE